VDRRTQPHSPRPPRDGGASPQQIESRRRLFVRKYVRADLRGTDRFYSPSPYSLTFSTPDEFLAYGIAVRLLCVVGRTVWMLCCALGSIVGFSILGDLKGGVIVVLLFFAASSGLAWMVVASQAFLRWRVINLLRPRTTFRMR
jgi:hypothetical protein